MPKSDLAVPRLAVGNFLRDMWKLFRHVCKVVWQVWQTSSVTIWRFFICSVTLEASEMQGRCFLFCFFLDVFMIGDMRTRFHKCTLAIKEARRPSRHLEVRDSQTCWNLQSGWQTENVVRFCMLHLRPLSHIKSKKIRLKSHFMQSTVDIDGIHCWTWSHKFISVNKTFRFPTLEHDLVFYPNSSYNTTEPQHKFLLLSSVNCHFLGIQIAEDARTSSWLYTFIYFFSIYFCLFVFFLVEPLN